MGHHQSWDGDQRLLEKTQSLKPGPWKGTTGTYSGSPSFRDRARRSPVKPFLPPRGTPCPTLACGWPLSPPPHHNPGRMWPYLSLERHSPH